MRVSRHTNPTAYLRAQKFNKHFVAWRATGHGSATCKVISGLAISTSGLHPAGVLLTQIILQLLTWLSRVALQAMAGAPHQYIACKIVSSQHKARGHHSMRYSQPLLRLGLVKLQGQRCRDVCCQIYRQVDRRNSAMRSSSKGAALLLLRSFFLYWEQAFEYSKCVPLESSWYMMICVYSQRVRERRETRTDTYRREISKHL